MEKEPPKVGGEASSDITQAVGAGSAIAYGTLSSPSATGGAAVGGTSAMVTPLSAATPTGTAPATAEGSNTPGQDNEPNVNQDHLQQVIIIIINETIYS